jgi:hypothetical protein
MTMKQITGLVMGAIVLALIWFLVSPLFIDVEVDEALGFTNDNGAFNLQRVMDMPEDKRDAMREDIMAAAASAPDGLADEAMPSQPLVVATGEFIDADAVHKGEGQATLYRLPDGTHLVRFENFRVTNGPALYVYLSKHPLPASAADVIDSGFLSLGKLKGNVGNQNYALPAGASPEAYGSVVIWCELFGVLFSPASLKTES